MHGDADSVKRNAYVWIVQSRNQRDDRAMRIAFALLLLACGTPSAQPVGPAPIEEDDRPFRAASVVRLDAGAGVTADADNTLEEITQDNQVAPDAGTAEIEFKPAAANQSNVTYEDGVAVVAIAFRLWCATSGPRKGFCSDDAKRCAAVTRSKCYARDNGSCFQATFRTSGQTTPLCWESYSLCSNMSEAAADDAETSSVGDCVIVRRKKGK